MYKNLTREEQKIIRETVSKETEPIRKRTIIKNALLLIFGFTIFVIIGYLIVYFGGR